MHTSTFFCPGQQIALPDTFFVFDLYLGVLAVPPVCGCLETMLYPWHRPEDIRRYTWYMTRDIAAVISRVISFGYRYAFHKVRSSGLPGVPVSRSLF